MDPTSTELAPNIDGRKRPANDGFDPTTSPINLEDIGTVHFRLPAPGDPSKVHLLRADVKLDGSTIFVYVSLASEGWPFVIENDSDYPFTFWQTVSSEHTFEGFCPYAFAGRSFFRRRVFAEESS